MGVHGPASRDMSLYRHIEDILYILKTTAWMK
jgi:hypothetical protein